MTTDSTPSAAQLQRMLARDEIREVLARYARAVDRADGPLLKSCYHPDAIEEHGGNYTGNAIEYVDGAIPRILAMGTMQHLLGTSHIELDGDVAWVETYIWTFARFAQAGGGSLDTFTGGRLVFRDGDLAGHAAQVQLHRHEDATVSLALWEPAPRAIAPGMAFAISAGCDKSLATCTGRFDNLARFRGFPHMPGNDFVTKVAFAYALPDLLAGFKLAPLLYFIAFPPHSHTRPTNTCRRLQADGQTSHGIGEVKVCPRNSTTVPVPEKQTLHTNT